MRQKTAHVVLTFSTTNDAMAAETAAKAGAIPGRMIPVPSEISAGCGLAWCAPLDKREELLYAFECKGLVFEGAHEVLLY